jgi:prevent-host-death family protein
MTRLATSKAREMFSDILNRVAYAGERIVLQRRGKDLAAIIPLGDLNYLEELEDRLDVEAARTALDESKERIPYDKVRKELGL